MKSDKPSSSDSFVSEVTSFVAGKHLYGNPRPSSFEIFRDIRRLKREIEAVKQEFGFDGIQPRKPSALSSLFGEAMDTISAALWAVMLGTLRIVLFCVFAGLMLMAIPTVLQHL